MIKHMSVNIAKSFGWVYSGLMLLIIILFLIMADLFGIEDKPEPATLLEEDEMVQKYAP